MLAYLCWAIGGHKTDEYKGCQASQREQVLWVVEGNQYDDQGHDSNGTDDIQKPAER